MTVGERTGAVLGGKYRLVRLIGEGGMGEVYEAQHAVIGRRFAIKFLHAHLARSSEFMERFQREARAAGALENENIAAAVDFGVADDGSPFLVMEFLEGEDLGRLLARTGSLPVARAVSLVIQACRGLLAAHDRGIVHRDLKPENLFICRRNDGGDLVKVLDFGIAKLRDQGQVTRSGATMGTPAYMSIEQARGAHEVDQRADIYSLGVILYELLSGSRPHPGTSYHEILVHIVTATPIPLASLRPLPAALCAVVERAMAREAADRFSSVIELWEALAPFADRAMTPPGSQVTEPAPVTTSTAVSSPVAAPTTPRAVVPRRRSAWWLALAPVLVGAALWLALRHPAPVPRAPTATEAAPAALAAAPALAVRPLAPPSLPDAAAAADARPGREPATPPPPHPPRTRSSPRATAAAPPAAVPVQPGPRRTRPFDRTNPYEDTKTSRR